MTREKQIVSPLIRASRNFDHPAHIRREGCYLAAPCHMLRTTQKIPQGNLDNIVKVGIIPELLSITTPIPLRLTAHLGRKPGRRQCRNGDGRCGSTLPVPAACGQNCFSKCI
jgi:hypothetical protein